MTEQTSQSRNPGEEIARFWLSWMTAGLDAMQRAAGVPPFGELHKLREELEAVRLQVETTHAAMATLETLIQGQQRTWESLERMVEQAVRGQQDVKQAMASWSSEWEDRVTRSLEDWRARWEDTMRQGLTMTQSSQQNVETLAKSMVDLSERMMGLRRGGARQGKE